MQALIKAADLFCGASGTGTAIVEACRELNYEIELTGWNHWDVAIATSQANHPYARHFCAGVDNVNPRDHYREGELDLLWASPECTHHSIARGGKPINDQSRATAFCVTRWAEALRPPIILVENVKEFQTWGPIGSNGRPLKSRKGEIFYSWIRCLESIGYRVEWRVLCAADYGDPTTRERLFIYAVRGKRKIVWPEPTHGEVVLPDMFIQRQRWLSARDYVIDWSLPGKSIYGRKKPLADKTLNRIWAGYEMFGLEPFTVHMEHQGSVRDINRPIPTITTAKGGAIALSRPFLIHYRNGGSVPAKSIDRPVPAISAGGNHLGLIEPFLIQVNHGNGDDKNGDYRRVRSIDRPFATVAGNRGEWALCQPFITEFYGNSTARSIDEPLGTVTTRDRFGLVMPVIKIEGEKYFLDTHFRMLKPHELAAAQGFPKDYVFYGKKKKSGTIVQNGNTTDIVKQIGNAVPKNLAKALVRSAITQTS